MADEVWGVTGTVAHVGQEGEEDSSIYARLCKAGRFAPRWNVVMDGKRLWWAHHGIRIGGRAWTRANPLYWMAMDTAVSCAMSGKPRPDVIVAHDRHVSPAPVTAEGITVAVCPCWQMSNYYGATVAPFSEPDLGVLTWVPSRNEVRRVTVQIDSED